MRIRKFRPLLCNIKWFILLLVYISQFFTSNFCYATVNNIETKCKDRSDECCGLENKKSLLGGWILRRPYQFEKSVLGGTRLSGMDVDILKHISERLGIRIQYQSGKWQDHLSRMKIGSSDIGLGATYTDDRKEFAYFSEPYRFEDNSLFMRKNSEKELNFNNITEYLAQVRLQNFRIGIIKGASYGNKKIDQFVNDESNNDIIKLYDNDYVSLNALMTGEIDGFMCDRIIGSTIITEEKVHNYIEEIPLNSKNPIHLMFSKKSVSPDMVNYFNHEIIKFLKSDEYKNIVKTYLYPIMFIQTIDSTWFYIFTIIGTIGFALSGIAIGIKENATLLVAFLFSIIPSITNGIVRDLIINNKEVGIFFNPYYTYQTLLIVLIGFLLSKLLCYSNIVSGNYNDNWKKHLDLVILIGDRVGQSVFIITGISLVIIAKIEPLVLCGTFFAFLTANFGIILRDILRNKNGEQSIYNSLNFEIFILWSLIFSISIDQNLYDHNLTTIRNVIIITVFSSLCSSIFVYLLNIPNIKFGLRGNIHESEKN